MRIALVNLSLSPGRGSDLVVHDLARALAREHEVDVYALRPAILRPEGIRALIAPPSGTGISGALSVLGQLRKARGDYEVVNCHHAVLSHLLPSERLVTTYHGYRGRLDLRYGKNFGEMFSAAMRRFVIRTALARSRHITIVSKSLLDEAEASGADCSIVYNAVDQLSGASEGGWPAPYLLYVGRIDADKGVDRLLRMYASTNAPIPLLIVGEGPDRPRLQAEYSDRSVVFLGPKAREELPALYSNATCFVTASTYETFCLPVIEAAQFGCPSLGPASGSLPEVINPDVTGFLYDGEADFPAALHRLLQRTPDAKRRMSEACKEWAAGFGWQRALAGYESAYRRVAPSTSPAAGPVAA